MKPFRILLLVTVAALCLAAVRPPAAGAPPVTAAVVYPTPSIPPGVLVTDPSVLPPPGSASGWVDHPCSDEVRFWADWHLSNGQTFSGWAVIASSMVVTDIGTPAMVTDGADVVTTFAATLKADVTTLFGEPLSRPLRVAIPGQMSVRLIGNAGKTTGTFLVTVAAMTFSDNQFLVKLDPDRPSRGVITVTASGGGKYAVECGVDIYSVFSLNPGLEPPEWLPLCADANAPTHYELQASNCPASGALFADFAWDPPSPANGTTVTFTDGSAGGPVTWMWSFGDGGTSYQQSPTHAFAAPGQYAVRLVVYGPTTAASASKSVRVGPMWGHGGPSPRRILHGVPVAPHGAPPR